MQLVQWGLSGSFPAQCSQVREVEAGKENLPCKPERVAVSPATSQHHRPDEDLLRVHTALHQHRVDGLGQPASFTQN